ncbi:MAG: SusD/RagB family nutrient-binding outer membrane lipoprotein [Candidatus Cyclobacteriaceae bacterium M2_1C_046]
MKKLKYIIITAISALLISTTGCDFGDINIDPTRQFDVEISSLLPTVQAQVAYNIGANPNRVTGIVIQQYEGVDAQQLQYTTCVIDENTFNNFWNFGLYAGLLNNLSVIIEKANEEELPHYSGIAKILMAHQLGMATSFFGNIPFSEALQGTANLNPSYDSQEQIYSSIQTLLNEAISELGQPAVPGGPSGADDIIFGGNADLWTATAYALKARFTMHLTRRNANAASEALGYINQAMDNGFTSEAAAPKFQFEDDITGGNPLAIFGQQRPNTLAIAEDFVDRMDATLDPRKEKYMAFDGSKWVYFQAGDENLFWSQFDSYLPLISYPELKFLEAEAKVRAGAADAKDALTEAVQASMDQLGVEGAEAATYIAANIVPETADLQLVMNQKYDALFAQAPQEIWVDYRRTDSPGIIANQGCDNGLNPGGGIPRRYLYPIDERLTNRVSYEAAIAAQGGHLMNVDLWAFAP